MNYYEILEIDPESTTPQIKLHYYRLAKKYHPDKHNGDLKKQEHFKRLSEAYSTLSNPRKRYLYDIQLTLKDLDYIKQLSSLNLQFSDEELLILHSYYTKVRNSTEVKFLELLFKSFPADVKHRVYQKINELKRGNFTESSTPSCMVLTDISHQKLINCEKLTEAYKIQLYRSLSDVYETKCKEIRIILSDRTWILFITHSDYQITFTNNGYPLVLSIETVSDSNYHIDGHDLHLSYESNLYEHYYVRYQQIQLPHNRICTHDKQDCVLENRGLKDPLTNRRGQLFIHQKLNLVLSEDSLKRYKHAIKQIFQ
jgi:curved DNA-binding protein CbpA